MKQLSSHIKKIKEICKKGCTENNKKTSKTIDSPYYDFSPIDVCLDEDKSSYEEEFNQIKYALENEKVKNLAILGKFGTGKSSLVSSFFKHAKINNKKISEKEYVTVSLADFDYLKENSSDNIEDDRSDILISGIISAFDTTDKVGSNTTSYDRVDTSSDNNQSSSKSAYHNLVAVEKEIIRQLSYGKLSKNVPISFLSKIKTRLWDTFVISLFLSPLLVLVLSSFFIKDEIVHLFNYTPGSTLTKLLGLTTITAAYVFIFFKFISPRLRLKHISLSSLSISVEQIDSDNIIDACLDEITYLFEQSKCKYVIFEDLDRGNNPEVFTHLRNLNFVLNNDIRCKNKNVCFWKRFQRRIVFIYLLRNDLLSPQEMVKFFDYTLSITPYAASSNVAFHALKIRDYICEYYKKLEGEKTSEKDKTSEDELIASQEVGDNVPTDEQNKKAQKSSERNIFKKSELFTEDALDNDFIISVSRFVGDLRNIKQILNDYQLLIGNFEFFFEYSEIIGKKLFSISALKNYYPSDYNELISNKGKLYELLNRLGEYKSFVKIIKSNLKTQFDNKNTNVIVEADGALRKIDKERIKAANESNLKELEIEFKNIEDKYSFFDLISKKQFDPDICLYVKSRALLRYLLCNNYLSEDYRFYVSRFSKQFSLNQREYSFLRKIYDSKSEYQPNLSFSKDHLDLIFLLLPKHFVSCNAILNIDLFYYALDNCTKSYSLAHGIFLDKYVKAIFKSSFGPTGHEFIFLLCSQLNQKLKDNSINKDENYKNIKRLFLSILSSITSENDLLYLFTDNNKNAEFLLYYLVYFHGANLGAYKVQKIKSEGVHNLEPYLESKEISNSIIKKLTIIPIDYWRNFFRAIYNLGVSFNNLPNAAELGQVNVLDLTIQFDKCVENVIKDGFYLPFSPTWKNYAVLANLINVSDTKDKLSNDSLLKEKYINNFFTFFFDKNNDVLSVYTNLRKTIFYSLFCNYQFVRLLYASGIYKKYKFSELSKQFSFLEDSEEIVLALLVSLNAIDYEKECHEYWSNYDLQNKVNMFGNVRFEQSITQLYEKFLDKYALNKRQISNVDRIKLCFLDYENICIDNLKTTFGKVTALLNEWKKFKFYEFCPSTLNFGYALIKTQIDLLNYSFVTKVNSYTPIHRVSFSLDNLCYIRDSLLHYEKSISIQQEKSNVDGMWLSLSKFYISFFDEIAKSNPNITLPKLKRSEDIQGTFENNIKRIKEFFLNLDKQD